VKILIIVNESPWGSSLGVTALRLARAMLAGKAQITAVFFRGDGVYHTQPGRITDGQTPALNEEWQSLGTAGIPLLVCSSAAQRRMPEAPAGTYREAGLVELMEIMASSDRVVTF
jgi:tRNA 2-thiouridine synthesizing protein D